MTSALSPGELLDGRYRIERMLAEGGVGVVALAHHLQLDRPVAIKLLRPEALGQRDLVVQFEREARLCAKLKSEHVVRVHDVGVEPHVGPYMVMELLEGEDLEGVLQQNGPLPLELAVEYVLQACEALAEVHDNAIVHRDLKPANLFLARNARGDLIVKVIDFGISKQGFSRDELTAGTPAYMAPEQIQGDAIDSRADVWALGVVLFELLTGAMPFPGDTIDAICQAIVNRPPLRLADVRPDLPPALDGIVQRCLEKDPARRFQLVRDLALALAPLGPLGGADLTTSSASLRLRRQAADPRTAQPTVVVDRKKKKAGLAVPVAIGVAAAGAIVVLTVSLLSRKPAVPPPPELTTTATPASASAPPPPPVESAPAPTEPVPAVVSAEPPKVAPKTVPKPRGSNPRGRETKFGGGMQ